MPIDGVLGVRLSTGESVDEPAPLAAQWLQGSFLDQSRDATGVYHLLDPEVLFRQITLATA